MTHHQSQFDCRPLQDGTPRPKIVYEIYPDLTGLVEGTPMDWFEIALYAEVSEYLPPDHPRSREAFSALMDAAELLVRRLPVHPPCMFDLSASYYTLHPKPASGDSIRTTLSRSLSLVFSGVEPGKHREEPRLLTELRTQLDLLNITRFEAHRGYQAEFASEKPLNDSTHISC